MYTVIEVGDEMKKKHDLKSKDNLIFFPGMVERLIQDGLTFAEENNHARAVQCFDEASKYVELDDMFLSIYIFSLLETRRYEDAREICEDLMDKNSPMYEQIVDLYLTVLLDLKEFSDLDRVLNRLLMDKRFSKERKQNFMQLKELSEKLATEQASKVSNDVPLAIDKYTLEVFLGLRVEEQEQLLQDSFYHHSMELIEPIIRIAESNKVYPAIQSLALLALGAIGVEEKVTMEKFGFRQPVNPLAPPIPNAMSRLDSITSHILSLLDKDPTKFEMTIGMLNNHAYALFPFDWSGYTDEEVAKGYVGFVEQLFGEGHLEPNELHDLIVLLESSAPFSDNV